METPKSEYDDITPVVAPAALFTNHSAGVHTPPGSPELLKQDRRVNRCKLSHLGIVLCFSAMVAGCVVIASEMFGVSFMVAALSFGNGLSGWPGSASFDGALIQLVLPPTTWGFLGNTGEFAIKVGFA